MRPHSRRYARVGWVVVVLAGVLFQGAGRWVVGGESSDYLTDIKPMLARHCVGCHGSVKPRADLRLDTAAGILRGGRSGPSVVPGSPEESELWLAVKGAGVGERMPLNRKPLSESEMDRLRAWIEAGAPAPEQEEPSPSPLVHWAFEPVGPVAVPRVPDDSWSGGPIDAFVRDGLSRAGLAPSQQADRVMLLRRASLDVIGLPPTVEEVDAFLADERPDAYERQIDRLLASPHYGEKWGRWWLDAARYADSHGYSIDAPRSMWVYREWVIDALNRDQPFDEFTIDQLAGDLRPNPTRAQRIATGFHRNTPINMEGGIDVEQFRVEAVVDRVNTTASVWLGLTLACAQCHDHKYDPITQQDYYRLFAFFNSCDEPELAVASEGEIRRQQEIRAEVAAYLAAIEADPELLRHQQEWELGLTPAERQGQSEAVRKALDVTLENRDAAANRPVFAAFVEQSKVPAVRAHQQKLAELRKREPRIVTTLVVSERARPRVTHVLAGGDFTRPGVEVQPGTPGVLPSLRSGDGEALSRLDLARWIVDRSNPLTARVLANRVWQVYFGRGLVETDGDFGTQGSPPTHPELLDWLASGLVESGWSLKRLHRTILTSAVYCQDSRVRAELAERDPTNERLGRQNRLRLEAELVRDSALAASGLLARRMGGPSVFPPQPDGVMSLGQIHREWKADTGPNRHRRGLYTYVWRATPHPLLTVFDAPDAARTCTRRARSNTPLQALLLLNDEAFVECACALARRLCTEGPTDDTGRLEFAFRVVLGRRPLEGERSRLTRYLEQARGTRNGGFGDGSPSEPACDEEEVWTGVARILLNLDEFMTRE